MIFKTFICILFKACFSSFLFVEQKQNEYFEEIAMHAENGMSFRSANKCYIYIHSWTQKSEHIVN